MTKRGRNCMRRILSMLKLNTLRNQMLLGFLAVMLIILTFVGGITFHSVSTLLKNNAEKHIQQTAIQANGRLESVLEQINSLTTLVSTNDYIQQLLLRDIEVIPLPLRNGKPCHLLSIWSKSTRTASNLLSFIIKTE